MDSMYNLTEFISMRHEQFFEPLDDRDYTGRPFVFMNFYYDVEGERIEGITHAAWQRFAELADDLSVRNFVMRSEPLPMEVMVDPEDAENERDLITEVMASLVEAYKGVEGLIGLIVYVTVEAGRMGDECALMDVGYVGDLSERRMKMCLVGKNKTKMGDEDCSICCAEMTGVDDGVVCTPCSHRFHGPCLGKWFQGNGSCPLCRFGIEPEPV